MERGDTMGPMRRGKRITMAAIAIIVPLEKPQNKHPTALKL